MLLVIGEVYTESAIGADDTGRLELNRILGF